LLRFAMTRRCAVVLRYIGFAQHNIGFAQHVLLWRSLAHLIPASEVSAIFDQFQVIENFWKKMRMTRRK
jgi:hypothetical protein